MRPATDAEKKKAGVPPAYFDVMVTDDPNSEVVATAKFYKPNGEIGTYRKRKASYTKAEASKKWSRVCALHRFIPKLQERIDTELQRKHPRHYGEAMALRVILETGIRNGGDEQEGEEKSYGVTNMLMEHVTLLGLKTTDVEVVGDTVRMQFPGKSGVWQDHTLVDAEFASYIRRRQVAGKATVFDHTAQDTLDYMKAISGGKFLVKDLRTYVACVLADAKVRSIPPELRPKNKKEFKALRKQIAEQVADVLGNTYSMALNSYIHPAIWTRLEPPESPKKSRKKR